MSNDKFQHSINKKYQLCVFSKDHGVMAGLSRRTASPPLKTADGTPCSLCVVSCLCLAVWGFFIHHTQQSQVKCVAPLITRILFVHVFSSNFKFAPRLWLLWGCCVFVVALKIVFIFRERRMEGQRGRETSMCGCLSHVPNWGPSPQLRHVP